MLSCLSPSLPPPPPPPPSCLIFYLFLSCFVLSSLVYSCLVWSLLICFWPGRVFFDSNNPFLSELCVICVQTFHSLCVNHVLPYITLPLFSHTRFTIPLHLKEKSEAQNLCDKCYKMGCGSRLYIFSPETKGHSSSSGRYLSKYPCR